jgi:cytochrome c-type biogenesis protein
MIASNIATQLVALFGAGVASFLAPCIIPLVPAYLGIIAGEVSDAHDPARAVPATLLFIAGFTTVFAFLGAVAGLIGSSLASFQHGVRVVGGVVIVIMGLALLGVLRGPFARERRLIPTLPKVTGVARPYVVGIAFGAGWSPCVGPLLAAALTIAARSGAVGRGTLLLCAYAAGIGVPFLLASLGLASSPGLTARLQRAGPTLERVAGALLIVLGTLLATNTYVHLTSYLARFVPSVHGL